MPMSQCAGLVLATGIHVESAGKRGTDMHAHRMPTHPHHGPHTVPIDESMCPRRRPRKLRVWHTTRTNTRARKTLEHNSVHARGHAMATMENCNNRTVVHGPLFTCTIAWWSCLHLSNVLMGRPAKNSTGLPSPTVRLITDYGCKVARHKHGRRNGLLLQSAHGKSHPS